MNRYKLYKAGVDVNSALERLGDDKELYDELLHTFKNETYLEKLKAAMDAGNPKEAFAAAHAMKGESGNMGFSKLYEALCPLVDKLRNDDLSDTGPMYEKVSAAFEELKAAIE